MEKVKVFFNKIKSDLVVVLIGIIISVILVKFVGVRAIIQGDSMYPTLVDQQSVIASKISYTIGKPERFDIVVIDNDKFDDKFIIKRVIGLPGETVSIDNDGNIYINNELLEENYGYEKIMEPGIALEGVTLGENEYFVLGDNRNNSLDSRSNIIGKININDIMAKAIEIELLSK